MTQNIRRNIGPYKVIKSLSYGAFSEVALVARKGELFACKIISRKSILGYEESFKNEILIHRMMHHPNIVELIDLLMDDENFYLIIEYCSRGDLCEFLARHGRIPEKTVKLIAKQLIMAVDYIHSKSVTHRDIKPENLMIDAISHVKLTDFGLSDFFNKENNDMVTKSCGSILYASPECLSGQPYNGRSTDAWSCGMTLYSLITGRSPWKGQDEETVSEEIFTTEIRLPRFLSPLCCDFLNRLLERDWQKRMTIEEALKHPWLDCSSIPSNRARGSFDISKNLSTPSHSSNHIMKGSTNFSILSQNPDGKVSIASNNNGENENHKEPRRNNEEVSKSVITDEKMDLFLESIKEMIEDSPHISCDDLYDKARETEPKLTLIIDKQMPPQRTAETPKAMHTASGINAFMNSIDWK